MSEQLRVMISSTARDLPEHRAQVMDACLRVITEAYSQRLEV